MKELIELFGQGRDLTMTQMGCRGILVFVFALLLLRISGRRSFGIHNPLDNIISLLLGAMLSRAIAGVSPFWPIMFTCLIIVLLHRLLGYLLAHNDNLAKMIEGDKIVLYKENQFIKENMKRAIVCEKDIMQGVRKSAMTENLDTIDKIYIETNGQITTVRKPGEEHSQ